MNIKRIIVPNLKLFDGAAAGAAGEGGAEAAPAAPAAKKGGELANVRYGRQAEGTPEAAAPADNSGTIQTGGDPAADREKAWKEMISGEYKDLYTADTQRIIDRRFAKAKEQEARLASVQPVLDLLAQRYNITDGDAEKLAKALEDDDAYWTEAAEEAGMSVNQYKAMQRLERENKALIDAQRRREGEQRANAQLDQWSRESEALKAKFPAFNLQAEAQNPQFIAMLRSNVPMEHAYKVIHMDELMNATVQQAAAVTEQCVVNSIRAKGQRPAEAGLGANSGVVVKNDVSKLNKADRAEIARRAMRGETITF